MNPPSEHRFHLISLAKADSAESYDLFAIIKIKRKV